MKKEVLFFFVFLLVLNLSLINAGLSFDDTNILELLPKDISYNYMPIKEKTDFSQAIGFKEKEIIVENAQTRMNKDGSVEIVLEKDGKITFGDKSSFLFRYLPASDLDLSKPNRFVFKDGKMIEAGFTVSKEPLDSANAINTIPFGINGINFLAPSGSSVSFIGDDIRVRVKEVPNGAFEFPRTLSDDLLKYPSVSYIMDGKKDNLLLSDLEGRYGISLKEGEVSFKTNIILDEKGKRSSYDQVLLYGNKGRIVLGDYKDASPIMASLSNMVISDSGTGVSVFFNPSKEYEVNNPYITLKSYLEGSKDSENFEDISSKTFSLAKIDMSINPSKTDRPVIQFNPGNNIIPGMTSSQYFNIDPADGRIDMSTIFTSDNNGNRKVSFEISAYSPDAKIIDSGNEFGIGEVDGKLKIFGPRFSFRESYPFKLYSSSDRKDGLTVNNDLMEISGKPVIMNSKSSAIPSSLNQEQIPSVFNPKEIKLKIQQVLINIFGDEKGLDFTERIFGSVSA